MLDVKHISFFGALAFAFLLLGGCPKSLNSGSHEAKITFKSSPGEPIAKVGAALITNETIAEQMAMSVSRLAKFDGSPEAKKELVEDMIRQEVIIQEAIRRGYLNDPEIQKEIKKMLVQTLAKEENKKLQKSAEPISEDEKKAFYDENPKYFHQPERIRAAHIFIPFGQDKIASLKIAREAYAKASGTKNKNVAKYFKGLVEQYSTQAPGDSKPVRPQLQTKEQSVEKFGEKAANALWAMTNQGTVSPLVEGEKGYYIFNLIDRRKPSDQDFETARGFIENRISKERRREAFTKLLEDLKKDIGVTIYEDRLSKLDLSKDLKAPHVAEQITQ